MIKIRCKNNNNSINIEKGTSLFDIFSDLSDTLNINPVCAKVNNKVCSLDYRVYKRKDIEFLDLTSPSAQRTYMRTLFLVLAKAMHDLYPEWSVILSNPMSNGFFCYIKTNSSKPTAKDVQRIRNRMQEIIDADHKIQYFEAPTEEVITRFSELGMDSKVKLLKYTGNLYTSYYELDGYVDYFYGALLPRTSMLTLYGAEFFNGGILLRIPSRKDPSVLPPVIPQEKMSGVFKEFHLWQHIIGIETLGDFNEAVAKGFSIDLINISEALQEKKIAKIAEQIADNSDLKVVLLAGPSSSGKTSTCKRLSIQLLTCGIKPLQISLDDYFVDRENTPRMPNGDYDYESIYALNLELFNQQLNDLLEGKEVQLPRYNFLTGKSETSDKRLQLRPENILVIEGIHALNPTLTSRIPDKHIFRIYASALTTILLDEHNYIPTTDNRLLRRIVRDAKTRGCDARETIRRWPSVREGEEKWIFPYQENADAMFNTAMLFELAALKAQAEPLLERVPENCEEYSEAYRLLKFLRFIPKLPDMHIPPTSLLREFLGGSSFEY